LRKRVQDKKDDIENKLKEARTNLETNDDIRLLKGKLARRDKEINDLKKKT
jgi:ribosome-interacting GTPase 1